MTKKQTRVELRSYEIRVDEIDGKYIEGRLVPYGVWTDIGPFREKFVKGAFGDYLDAGGDVIYNYGHDRTAIMGRRSSGTLVVEERGDGVYGRLEIPDTSLGRDMRVMIDRGDITGHSVEFVTHSDRWEMIDDVEHRTVLKADLPGVALTANPAYKDTTAALRSLGQWREHEDEVKRAEIARRMKMRAARFRASG